MAYYIQRKDERDLETVDEAETMKDARYLVGEYRLADPTARYYVSTRACRGWNERGSNDDA